MVNQAKKIVGMAKKKDRRNLKSKSDARNEDGQYASDDEGSMCNDAASVTSEAGSLAPDTETEAVDESSKVEMYEAKLREALELATQKSAAGRLKALEAICQAFLKRYCPDFIENQQVTTCDVIERALKKGKGGEIEAGARLAVMLALQLSDPENVYKELKPVLVTILQDKTASATSRASVASSLAGLCFLGGGEMAEVLGTMALLEAVHSNVLSSAELTAAAVSGWSLLLSLQSPGEVTRIADPVISKLSGHLNSGDVEVRITAGEAIALVLEFAYDYDEEFEPENMTELIETLRQLATDSTKSRSKKDRKEQRSSFRDILGAVEEGHSPSERVKFGQEVLYLDSWYKKLQYDWFCKLLGSGMNLHLSANHMIREIFELPPPLPAFDQAISSKMSKTQRNAANQLSFKLRTQSRNKNRGKRSEYSTTP